ncbi:hypothetical protein Prudu_012442 [Prunus dulcis]|uniref:Uncharacterized protein n=1 Tax=Prunus dulcis TaxID=3755 RepID=A0A4Y1RDD0_PRUDU|nr:hypothetical protein Prudu_012442 [Prunus dulcis]
MSDLMRLKLLDVALGSLMRMLLACHLQLISPTEATISSEIELILLRQLIASLWIIFFMIEYLPKSRNQSPLNLLE